MSQGCMFGLSRTLRKVLINVTWWQRVRDQGPVQAFTDILRKSYPSRTEIIPKGRPREGYRADYTWSSEEASLSARKVEAVGAIKSWIGLEQSVLDAAKELEKFI